MIRIQLSSNFQVVELTFNSLKDKDFDVQELNSAIDLVNELGQRVKASAKESDFVKPSEKQVKLAKTLGLDVTGKNKDEVRKMIQEELKK